MSATDKKDTEGFESSIRQLESIVSSLDSEDVSLEQALKSFEEGVTLVRKSQEALREAEQKVNALIDVQGDPHEGESPVVESSE